MLKICSSIQELNIVKLATVYQESNFENGRKDCPVEDKNAQSIYGDELFYDYVIFYMNEPGTLYCVWTEEGEYLSALRLEPFGDGWLLNGLETAPDQRRKGFAECLVKAVLEYAYEGKLGKIYSHINKRNLASIALHKKCGFKVICDSARYIDGSVHNESITLSYG